MKDRLRHGESSSDISMNSEKMHISIRTRFMASSMHQLTRDEWNNLLHLFNISIFSLASCLEAMSKRMHQGTGEERIVAKSKATLNLVSRSAASSPTAPSSSASSRPGILRAPSQQGSNLIAQSAGKLAAGNSDINDEDNSKWPHNLHISRANVPHLKKVYSNWRQQLKRKPEDKMEDLDVNTWIWRMFIIVTQQAAVHLGNDYLDNLHANKLSHKEQRNKCLM